MKKVIGFALMIVMLFSLVGCGANNDENNAKVQVKMDETEKVVQDIVSWYEENGYLEGEVATQMQPIVDSFQAQLDELKASNQAVLDAGGYSEDEATEMIATLDQTITELNKILEQQKTELGSNVGTLTEKYNTLVDLVTDATAKAEENGWTADEAFISEQNAAADYINLVSTDLQKPETIDEAYSKELSASLDEMIAAWTDYVALVSEPYVAE